MWENEGISEEMLRKILRDTDDRRKLNGVADLHRTQKLYDVLLPGTLIVDATHTLENDRHRSRCIEGRMRYLLVANKMPLAAEWAKAKMYYDHPLIRMKRQSAPDFPSSLR